MAEVILLCTYVKKFVIEDRVCSCMRVLHHTYMYFILYYTYYGMQVHVIVQIILPCSAAVCGTVDQCDSL